MNYSKQLEGIIDLMNVGAPYRQIQTMLQELHTELEAYEQAQAEQVKLAQKKTTRDAKRN